MSFRMSVMALVAMVFIGGLMIAGCGGGSSPTKPVTPPPPPPPPPPTVASIVVNPTSASMVVGGTQRFTASARASDGSTIGGVNFTWTSSNTTVVTINATGLAAAVSAGTAMIRATGNGISSAQVAVTVTEPPVANVTVSPSSAQEMTVGDTLSFTATARAANGTERDDVSITWMSSDTGVVSITSAGVATAVSAGMATIRAMADGVSSSPVTITVVEPPPPPPMVATVTVSPSDASIEESQTQQFEAMAMTDDGMAIQDVMFTWMSSDESVAEIDTDGLATSVSAGEVTITATADGVSGTALLTVTEPPPPPPVVATVMVTPIEASIEEGQEQQFEAMAETADGMVIPDVEFTWTSSDDSVATVDQTGLATGVIAGEVTITVTADGISSTAMLTVKEPPPPPPVVATVMVTPMEASIEEGQEQQFEAMAVRSDGMAVPDAEFTWMSSDDGVATVDPSGLAIGVSAGGSTISATVDGVSGMAMLTVTEPPPPPPPVVATVMVTPMEASIEERQTHQFAAMAVTADGMAIPDVEYTWMSSDENVATVDSNGLATGVSAGEAEITATVDGVSDMAILTVTEPPPVVATVMVSPPEASIDEGHMQQFEAVATSADGMVIPDVVFTWNSSSITVASVSQTGLATGRNAGMTTISAMAEGVPGTAELTVTEPPLVVARIAVNPPAPLIEKGDTQQFTAIARTADNRIVPDVTFMWSSSNPSVATVDASGLATAVGAGTAIIEASAEGISDTATLMVTEPLGMRSGIFGGVSGYRASGTAILEETSTGGLVLRFGSDFQINGAGFDVITIVSLILLLTSGCGKDSPTKPVVIPPPSVASVVVSPTSAKLQVGGTQRFTSTARTSDGSSVIGATITWTSSNTAVVSINAQGLATAVGVGTAIIRAVADGITSVPVTVTVAAPPIASVTINPSSLQQLTVGSTRRFAVTARTADGSTRDDVEVSWTSSNTAVVSIDSKGVATAVGIGMAIIRAVADGVTSSPVTITVTAPPIATVTVNPSAPQQLMVGSTRMFAATARTADGSTRDEVEVSWTSSNTAVVSIDSTGVATAVGTGMAIIRAVADGVTSAPVMITVIAPQVDSATISPSSPQQLTVGEIRMFAATVRTTDGSTLEEAEVTWTSSNTAVVTIDESGLATAVGVGTAMIRAVSGGVSSEPVMINVKAPPVMTVMVTPSMKSIEEGETQQFEAVVTRSDGVVDTDVVISWASSDEMVATIDPSGLATGVSVGEATIIATADGVSGIASLTVTEPPPPMIASITVIPLSMTFQVGGTFQFEATAWTSDGMVIPDVIFTWASDDTDVATVDDTGLVTAVGAGTAMITARADGVTSMPATVTVQETPPQIASITVDLSSVMLETGDTHQLSAVAWISDGTMVGGVDFEWSSDDIEVATVDHTGLVTAVGAGMAYITVMAEDVSSEPVRVTVVVPPPAIETIMVSPSMASIEEGETQLFEAVVMSSDGMVITDVIIMWMSSDMTVVTIDPMGLATGVTAGEVTITATADGVTRMATLTVTEPTPPVVASVTLDPSSMTIEVGETFQFTATAMTSDGMTIPNGSFTWMSDDDGIATVDKTGMVTAVAAGTAMITASVNDITSMPAIVIVQDVPPTVASVTVDLSSVMLEVGDSHQLTAVARTSEGMMVGGVDFEWSSDNVEVATVDQTGLVTAASAGTANITVMADGVSAEPVVIMVSEPPPVVDRIVVSPSSASIEEGNMQQFTAVAYTADDEEIVSVNFTWESSNVLVATIDSSGVATGVRAGSTPSQVTITASADGKTGMATLTVRPVISRVAVRPSSATIDEGSTRRFRATAYTSYDVAIQNVNFSWSSSNMSVATISSSGLARGVNAGSTTIRARAGVRSGTATLTVEEPPPVVDRIEISPSNATIDEGDTQRFTATARTSGGEVINGVDFTWTSSNESVATISSSGVATGVRAGTSPTQVTITANADGKSDTATLTVRPVISRVAVSPPSATINEGSTHDFDATAYTSYDVAISNVSFTWESSNTSIATINSSSGLARGERAGATPSQVTITARAGDKSDTATLTVRPVISRVLVSPPSATINEGSTHDFNATAYTSYNVAIQNVSFVWESSNTSVATINSSTGLSRGERAGATPSQVTITARASGKSDTASLTVRPVVSRVSVSPSSPSIQEGETQLFSAAAYTSYDVQIAGVTFMWESSNTTIATINASAGLATAQNAGSTTITATGGGQSGTASLTVTEPPPPPMVVASVSVSPSSASIEEGATRQFSATAYTSDNQVISGRTITWSSSTTSVATISSSGLATGADAGSTGGVNDYGNC